MYPPFHLEHDRGFCELEKEILCSKGKVARRMLSSYKLQPIENVLCKMFQNIFQLIAQIKL